MIAEAFATLSLLILPVRECSPAPVLDATVFVEHLAPEIRSTMTSSELRELAETSGKPLRHTPFGFYAGVFTYSVRAIIRDIPGKCGPAVTVTAHLSLQGRLVEIGTDLRCPREIVVSHYLMHAAQDDRVLSAYAGRLQSTFDRLSFFRPIGGAWNRADLQEVVDEAVQRLVEAELRDFDEKRVQASAAVDTATEVAKLDGACRG